LILTEPADQPGIEVSGERDTTQRGRNETHIWMIWLVSSLEQLETRVRLIGNLR
jgi:hypothetical protein